MWVDATSVCICSVADKLIWKQNYIHFDVKKLDFVVRHGSRRMVGWRKFLILIQAHNPGFSGKTVLKTEYKPQKYKRIFRRILKVFLLYLCSHPFDLAYILANKYSA